MALLYPEHPYNVASAKGNQYFVGNSPMVIIAEGKRPGAIKDAKTLNQLDFFQRHMEQGVGAGGSMTATTMLKTVFRVFHEGDPKWEMLPTRNARGQVFFMLTAGTRRARWTVLTPEYTNATVTVSTTTTTRDDQDAIEARQSTSPQTQVPTRRACATGGRRAFGSFSKRRSRGRRSYGRSKMYAIFPPSSSC